MWRKRKTPAKRRGFLRRWWRQLWIGVLLVGLAAVLLVALGRWAVPPITHTMLVEWRAQGDLAHDWVAMEEMSEHMPRAAVAAEDAGFFAHNGFEWGAIRAQLEGGAQRGASTISQQVAKNVYLWQGRSWLRKGLETGVTMIIEATWPKHRIIKVYLNVAETGIGTFGVQAAAARYYDRKAADLTAAQAAQIAAILPAPRLRDPKATTPFHSTRVAQIRDGAATIARDGRAACLTP